MVDKNGGLEIHFSVYIGCILFGWSGDYAMSLKLQGFSMFVMSSSISRSLGVALNHVTWIMVLHFLVDLEPILQHLRLQLQWLAMQEAIIHEKTLGDTALWQFQS